MDWILDKLPVVVFVIVAIVQVARAVLKPREPTTDRGGGDETEEQQRVREIQERIRRIASQRGQRTGSPDPVASEDEGVPPVLRPETANPEESFGELLRRGFEPPEQKVPAPVHVESRNFELERQAELAEKMRQLAEENELIRRRAVQLEAAVEEAARSEAGLLKAERARLEDELRDPQSLRRAFLLREVLGPPVALR